ncbi:hypothetical protein DWW50_07300 [Eubacterium sp. AF15-50]|uniref:Uncharacterized protein n=1 Tax=Eubacterium segne TaxID=2763045 RepID=A0ABR7F3F3_9FIRM|nr:MULTISPECIES: hypothetical protein [Eubacterium]MBC5668133.1 hypothetical protein [Eubacterium segne]RHR72036.1 hypothetical protein DWW68_08505 [Eubacterium sp. AF16-48]RHR79526.1 hypothetical protein DWW50_07300 [Eubacterium sp. AF15-50]
MKIKKTILAIMGIVVIIALAMILPIILNEVTNKSNVGKISYNDETAYEVTTGETKSTEEKLEILGDVLSGKSNAQVINVIFNSENKKLKSVEKSINNEYKKWLQIEKKLFGEKYNDLLFDGQLYFNDIQLYTIYDMGISYYVCDVVVYNKENGLKNPLQIYVDSDTMKIYLVTCKDVEIFEKMAVQVYEGKDNLSLAIIQSKIIDSLADYYGIEKKSKMQNVKTDEGIGVNLINDVLWQIHSGIDGTSVNIGISEFEEFTYYNNNFQKNDIKTDVKSGTIS